VSFQLREGESVLDIEPALGSSIGRTMGTIVDVYLRFEIRKSQSAAPRKIEVKAENVDLEPESVALSQHM
jgi:hypothetical protein